MKQKLSPSCRVGWALALLALGLLLGLVACENPLATAVLDARVKAEAPRLVLTGPGSANLAVGGTQNFTSTSVGGTRNLSIVLTNAGKRDLTVNLAGLTVNNSTSEQNFGLLTPPAATLSPGSSTTMVVTFGPLSTGIKTASLALPSNDPESPVFVLTLMGSGLATANEISAFGFVGLGGAGVFKAGNLIEFPVLTSTSISGLKASFTTTGVAVKIGAKLQVSGSTINDFTHSSSTDFSSPVVYTVSAEDGSVQNYTIKLVFFADPYIIFSGNGGTGTMANQVIPAGSSAPLSANTFTRTGYAFQGWATTAGGPAAYGDTASYTISTFVTLYAKWSPNTYKVTFHPNATGTAGSMADQPIVYDTPANLNNNLITKNNYTFSGWSTTPTGPVLYANQAVFTTPAANTDLYAVWTGTVTYIANGSTVTGLPSPTTLVDGAAFTIAGTLPSLGVSGGSLLRINDGGTSYRFVGWNTLAGGGGTSYAPGSAQSMTMGALTLYAQWSAYGLGDVGPAGGLIYFDNASYSGGWRYLEASASDLPGYDASYNYAQWSNYPFSASTANGYGPQGMTNSLNIRAVNSSLNTAAKLCLDYRGGGYNNWYLPTTGELSRMRTVLYANGIGSFRQPTPYPPSVTVSFEAYWSSEAASTPYSWYFNFSTNASASDWAQTGYFHVRASRYF